MQPHLRLSLRLVTSARSKLRPLSPPALHHCLAEAVVINFCPAGVSGLGKPDPLRPGSSFFRGARSLTASDDGHAVVGSGRDLRCAAMVGPRPIQVGPMEVWTPYKPTLSFARIKPQALLVWVEEIPSSHFLQEVRKNIKFWPSYDQFSKNTSYGN